MIKERDTAIDFVRIVALFLVLNSHMSICYESYSFLATGGGIGDALFFFISGFTLFLGRDMNFIDWYKKRISRIYPSLFAVSIIGAILFGQNDSLVDVLLAKRYWFIQCILVLYPMLYFAKRFVSKQFILLCSLTVIVLSVFPFMYKGDGLLYSDGYYRWAVYLLFMLLGALVGKNRERIKQTNIWFASALTLACIILWYAMIYLFRSSWLHVFSVLPLMGCSVFMYSIGKSKSINILFQSRIIGPTLITIGALCLDSYLVQKFFITDRLNSIFPWNIPLIFLIVLIASYITRIVANAIRQLLDPSPFKWRNLFILF